jgi:tellurite methyltransferase
LNFNRWNAIYAEPDVFGEPMQIVQEAASFLSGALPERKVLDVGAGQGRHAIPLARRGFNVTAIDGSEKGIEAIAAVARSEHLENLRCIVADLRQWHISEKYDLVVSVAVIHCLDRGPGQQLLHNIRAHTRPGGYNVIVAFLNEGDLFSQSEFRDKLWLLPGQLRDLYSDWQIVRYFEQSGSCRQTNDDGSAMSNMSARLIARRPF